jgi:hypothetical protein
MEPQWSATLPGGKNDWAPSPPVIIPKPAKASVVLWASSVRTRSRLNFAAGAGVMAAVAVLVIDAPALLVTLHVKVTLQLAPALNAMLSVLSPTMIVPFVTLQA